MTFIRLTVIGLLLAGCGAAQAPKQQTQEQLSSPASFADQAARGAQLYAANCASCHGDSGEGVPGPALVGLAQGALPLHPADSAKLRATEFRTALDVFLWVKVNMPPNKGGSLSDAEYVDIMAFDLKANGVELSTPLNATSAKALVLHP